MKMDEEMENSPSAISKEAKFPPLLISFITEFIGTSILMWLGCMGCLEIFNIGPVIPAFAFGLAITAAIQTFAHISPLHINPAVTIGDLILGNMDLPHTGIYILAQYLGATSGFAFLQVVMPWHEKELCVLKIGKYMDPVKAFFIEFGATMVLMFAVCGATDVKNKQYKDSLSLKLGLIVSGLVFSCEPFTGAGLNPARAFAPALLYNNWTDFWVYELAPFCGMALSAVIYRFVLSPQEKYSLHSIIKRHWSWCSI